MNNLEKNIEQNNNENKSKITNLIKDQKTQLIILNIFMFIAIILNNPYLFAISFVIWALYLAFRMPTLWKSDKILFTIYLILLILVLSILFISISGMIKFLFLR